MLFWSPFCVTGATATATIVTNVAVTVTNAYGVIAITIEVATTTFVVIITAIATATATAISALNCCLRCSVVYCLELTAANVAYSSYVAIIAASFAIAKPKIKPQDFDCDSLVTKTRTVIVSVYFVIVNFLAVSTKLLDVSNHSWQYEMLLASCWKIF